jgi:endonuclease-8
VARIARDPERPVGEALLDQRNPAGIGTFYVAEMLFLRGIDPWRPAGSVPDHHATRPGTSRPGIPLGRVA